MGSTSVAVATCLVAGFTAVPASSAGSFSARFSWNGIPACASVSPAFSISGVPQGTVALTFVLHDRDAPAFQHGGSTVPYAGRDVVPRGAISYVGPCPPPGETHRYVWTVEALDAQGKALGTSRATGSFSR